LASTQKNGIDNSHRVRAAAVDTVVGAQICTHRSITVWFVDVGPPELRVSNPLPEHEPPDSAKTVYSDPKHVCAFLSNIFEIIKCI
jgi:hypothetical protein